MRAPTPLTPAEKILTHLGITDPAEIDVDAIAWTMGAAVKYRPLDGCEARIVGVGDRAVITVHEGRRPERQRFSVGHELGHWKHHRGRRFDCRSEDIGSPKDDSPFDPERVADQFAVDLLMPAFLFQPAAGRLGRMTLDVADTLAAAFRVSLTAAAIRLVEVGPAPAMLICHGPQGRRWFRRHREVPATLFPHRSLDAESYARDVWDGKMDRSRAAKIGAGAWIDRRGADRYEVTEQTIRISRDTILSLVWWHDEAQLEAELRAVRRG